MPTCLITIKPSPTDHLLLEDYLILFKEWLHKYKHACRYSWSIEKDDTIDRHLHCYLEHNEKKGSGKIADQLKTTIFKNFIKTLPHTTIADVMINVVNSEDPKQHLGYVSKDHTIRHESDIADEEIISAIKYYFTTEKYKARMLEQAGSTPWKHVTSRTFHPMVEEYLKKNPELSLADTGEIILSMKSNFYTFQLPIRDNEKFFKEMKLSHNVVDDAVKHSAKLEAIGIITDADVYYVEDIKYLLQVLFDSENKLSQGSTLYENTCHNKKILAIATKYQGLFDPHPCGEKSYGGLIHHPTKLKKNK